MSTAKKILVVGQKQSGKLRFIQSLTGSLPTEIQPDSHGGLTHSWALENKYYTADIGIWVDEFEEDAWDAFSTSYSSHEAADVRASLGALVVTFEHGMGEERVSDLLTAMKVIGDACPSETILLAIGSTRGDVIHPSSTSHESALWEDLCMDEGFEYIDLNATGTNTFGEKVGMARAMGAIEACDWSETVANPSEDELLAQLIAEDEALNKRLLETDLDEREADIDESSVDELEAMMQRILTARGKTPSP